MCEAVDGCAAPVVARMHGYALGGGSGLVAAPTSRSPLRTPCSASRRCGSGSSRRSSRRTSSRASAPAPRGATSSPASGSTRHRRCGIGLVARGRRRPRRAVERVRRGAPRRRAGGRARREAAVREQPSGGARRASRRPRSARAEGQEGLRAFLEKRAPSWADDASDLGRRRARERAQELGRRRPRVERAEHAPSSRKWRTALRRKNGSNAARGADPSARRSSRARTRTSWWSRESGAWWRRMRRA